MSRRDAAIAAALAGTVVVVLGYASGLGVTVEPPITTLSPVEPVTPPSPAPEVAPTTESAPVPAVATLPEIVPARPAPEPTDHTSHPAPSEPEPDPDPSPDPTPDPSPDPPDPDGSACASLLEGLPIVGPATVPLTTLLDEVLATTQEALGLTGSDSSSDDHGSLGCLLGAVVGPPCCASAQRDKPRGAR